MATENASDHVRTFFQRQADSHRRCRNMDFSTSGLLAAFALCTSIMGGGNLMSVPVPVPDAAKEQIVKKVVKAEVAAQLHKQADKLADRLMDSLKTGEIQARTLRLEMTDADAMVFDRKKIEDEVSSDYNADARTNGILTLSVTLLSAYLSLRLGRDGIGEKKGLKDMRERLKSLEAEPG